MVSGPSFANAEYFSTASYTVHPGSHTPIVVFWYKHNCVVGDLGVSFASHIRRHGAQLAAGADAIVWADHATGDLIRNTMYRDFLLWRHQALVPQVPAPVILHCCGRSLDRIEFFRDAGFDM